MVVIDREKCVGCGRCVEDCVGDRLALEGKSAVYAGSCILCGHCVAICPTGAASIPGYDMEDVEEHDPARPGLDPGELLHAVKFRRSIRSYAPRAIEQEKLEVVIQAGRYSATGKNRQGCSFVVIQKELDAFKAMIWDELKEKTASPGDTPAHIVKLMEWLLALRDEQGIDYLFRNAPAVLFVGAKQEVDGALAAQSMELAAVSQGLGALYNGYLLRLAGDSQKARQWMGLEKKPLAVCMLMGYPAVAYRRTAPRKPADVRYL